MYPVADDRVVPLADIPRSSVGAPCPRVVADELRCLVGYYLHARDPGWDGTTVRVIDPAEATDPVGVVDFTRCYATMFGPPNDEAFEGHPLADRGLHPYGAFEVLGSSWIAQLERMNAVHPYHRREHFDGYRHVILAFHDSTFECIARGYTISRHAGPLARVGAWMLAQLDS